MDSVRSGRKAKTPKGFKEELRLCGRTIKISYFLSIKDISGKQLKIDACLVAGKNELWIATYNRTRPYIADAIWHEMKHYIFQFLGEKKLKLDEDLEEQIILLQEVTEPSLFRDNPWFHSLYAGGNT